jgi:hypothetical protein
MSYLNDRFFYVTLNNVRSRPYKLFAGVPQGSVLGPLLFILFINDAPRITDVDESIFADDKLIYTASFRISAIKNRLQKALAQNKRFFHKWKIKINEKKTEAILFTKRRPVIKDQIVFDNVTIEWQDKIKYLGVLLDKKLNFSNHVNYVIQKAIGNLIKLYPIFKNKYLSLHSKKIFYKSLIRSSMLYACPVWSLTCQSNLNKLQVTQNKFLRIIGNFRKFTPISVIHEETKMEYIYECMNRNVHKYFKAIESHKNNLVRNILYDNTVKYKHKRIMNYCK